MKISRLRLLGFKSFVEPTELVIEPGLTGVVGPNGCGKSNLLEALRWVMGETSYKSMRAAAMDDVIFSGTNSRPARNTAEVTIFLDNRERKAPAEFNDTDQIEITRRIEREAGSAYRINGREVRARDVQDLVRGRGDRRALAGAGAPRPDRRDRQRQAGAAPPHSRGRRGHRRAAQPPPRGGAAPQGDRGQSRAPQRRARPAQQPGRQPQAAGARGTALQGDLRRDSPPGRAL